MPTVMRKNEYTPLVIPDMDNTPYDYDILQDYMWEPDNLHMWNPNRLPPVEDDYSEESTP